MKKSLTNRKYGYNTKTSQQHEQKDKSAKQFIPAPLAKPLSKSFASVVGNKNDSNKSNSNVNRINKENNNSNVNNNSNELFTFAEVGEILLKGLNDLANCKNKIDQLRVIANMLQNVFD